MKVIDTRVLFQDIKDRAYQTYTLVQSIFPDASRAAVQYELQQQGLLEAGEMTLQLDVWSIVERQLYELQSVWGGPATQLAILPIRQGFVKNGVAYHNGICLFVSPHISLKELHALVTHEYHHICRQHTQRDIPNLLDSVIMEGLAEQAVESLFGEHALSSWTKRYSLNEVQIYWQSHFLEALHLRGIHQHQSYLFGDAAMQLPPHIGYCTGYRIIEAFLARNGPLTTQQLLNIPSEQLTLGAGFPLSKLN